MSLKKPNKAINCDRLTQGFFFRVVILFEFWFMMVFRVFIRRQIIGALEKINVLINL